MLRAITATNIRPIAGRIEQSATWTVAPPKSVLLPSPLQLQRRHHCSSPPASREPRSGLRAMEREGDGDFGARDPYAGEVATGFGSKSFGNADTDHLRRPPAGIDQFVGLKSKHCTPCEGGKVPALSKEEVEALRTQVGWKLVTLDKGVQGIRHEWKARNFKAALEIFDRIAEVAEAEGHHPDLHLEGYNSIRVELSTHAIGGLTLNDFIIASKLNDLNLSDLLSKRKPKFWA